MDIITKAKELGDMIAASAEMERLNKAEENIQMDDKSVELLKDYKQLQIDVVKAAKENKDKTEIDGLREKLMGKQQELNDYSITKEFFESKNDFDGLMKKINDVIIHAITGEEPCSPNKCGSCGGCK